jgi:hypothetical protein
MLYHIRNDIIVGDSTEMDAFIFLEQYVLSKAKSTAIQVIQAGNSILAQPENHVLNMSIRVQPGKISVFIHILRIYFTFDIKVIDGLIPEGEITLSRILVNFGRTDEIWQSNKQGTCINILIVSLRSSDWRVGTAFAGIEDGSAGFEGGICDRQPVDFDFDKINLPTMTNALVINFFGRNITKTAPLFGYNMVHELYHTMGIQV